MIWTKKITVCNWSLINWKKHKYNTVICRPSTCFWIVEYFDHSFDKDSLETLIHKSFKTYLCSFLIAKLHTYSHFFENIHTGCFIFLHTLDFEWHGTFHEVKGSLVIFINFFHLINFQGCATIWNTSTQYSP